MAPRRQILTGMETVRKVFRRLPEENLKRITNALNQGADDIAGTAKQIVPVQTGELRDAIEVERATAVTRTPGRSSRIISNQSNPNTIQVRIGVFPQEAGDPGFYAAWVEFGTPPRQAGVRRSRGKKKKSIVDSDTNKGTSARPFLFPAFWVNRKRVRNRIAREINRAAKAVAALGRR